MTATARLRGGLVDRHDELEALDGLIGAARAGSSGVLVLKGESGIGKTALLDEGGDTAAGMQLLRVSGIESEFGLSFAALHHLLLPLLDRVDDLPGPQRDALASAFGRREGAQPTAFLIGLAVLTLFANIGAREPVVCLIDDADFLDDASAEVLAFAARRLNADPVLMLFAMAGDGPAAWRFGAFPTLDIDGLSSEAARQLLDSAVGPALDRAVRERLVGELEGNPLALLEVAGELTPGQLTGASALPASLPLGERLETILLRRVRGLPDDSQRLLVIIAAERSGEPAVIWRAADLLGIDHRALVPAESLVRRGSQITFRHALVRSAVYTAAKESWRHDAHQALASSMDPVTDADRAVWHRATASPRPNETTAAGLEEAAVGAKRRGGYREASSFLELAARLTPERGERARRRFAAADAQLSAGGVDKASGLLLQTEVGELDELHQARARRLRATLALAQGVDSHASSLLLEAAQALERFDATESRSAYLQALTLTMFAGRVAAPDDVARTARAARDAPAVAPRRATSSDWLLDGYAYLLGGDYEHAAPLLRRGVHLSRRGDDVAVFGPSYQAAFVLWDDDALHALATNRVALARASGDLRDLPNGLSQLGAYEILAGRFDDAELRFVEADELARTTGNPGLLGNTQVGQLMLAAWRGDEARARDLAQVCAADGTARGLGAYVGYAKHAVAVLELGLGNYEAALHAAQDACLDALLETRTLPDLVEAAVRTGERKVAAAAVQLLERSARAGGTEWGLGMLSRSQALLASSANAEPFYGDAIERLNRSRATTMLARTRLVYGEWLRRRRRRRHARTELSAALESFEAMGASAFAQRAATELAATGERIRKRAPETTVVLTPHEWRIASLVGQGSTNSEVAAQLYISPKTVEYHLGKIFRKLGVSSRTQLANVLLTMSQDG
jgi:DNA-binding CsgD family transcriptional regulator